MSDTEFRTSEQEVLKLLEECAELKRTLKTISAQLGRVESRVKGAFPLAAKSLRERYATQVRKKDMTPEEALAEFDRLVRLAASGATEEAERTLESKSAFALQAIAKEVGVSFAKSKPSLRALREAVFGKIRESILLSRHNPRS